MLAMLMDWERTSWLDGLEGADREARLELLDALHAAAPGNDVLRTPVLRAVAP